MTESHTGADAVLERAVEDEPDRDQQQQREVAERERRAARCASGRSTVMPRPPAPEPADAEQHDAARATSSTTEIAAAPIGLSLSICLKMNIDATCVSNGMLPRDQHDRAELADRAGERERRAAEDRRHEVGEDHAPEDGRSRSRRATAPPPPSRGRARSARAARRGSTNGSVTNSSASRTANCVNATSMPTGLRRAVERQQREAGDDRRQRERQVDQRVDDALAAEPVAHEHPGDQRAGDRVDRRSRRARRAA